jgi:pullulanase/glycogen debranching enzyme
MFSVSFNVAQRRIGGQSGFSSGSNMILVAKRTDTPEVGSGERMNRPSQRDATRMPAVERGVDWRRETTERFRRIICPPWEMSIRGKHGAMLNYWYQDAIIYELDVKTFQDGDADGIGDFRGLIRRLPHIAGLGATCLWLQPFYPSPLKDDGYDVADYYAIDPRLGTFGDFVVFLSAARELGLRVIADLVVNHTSDEHPLFQSARRDPHSPYRGYYIWSSEVPKESPPPVYPGPETGTGITTRRPKHITFTASITSSRI